MGLVFLIGAVIAILAGIFAWGWNYNRGRQSLEFFGGEGAKLIRLAPRVAYHSPRAVRVE